MSLMIVITYEHSAAYRTSFIITVDFKCNFIVLINIILLRITIMLKSFFINIEFIALSFI